MTEAAADDRSTLDRHTVINRIIDQLAEFTDPRPVSEGNDSKGERLAKRHTHTLPSLLAALRAAVSPGGDNGQAGGSKAFESRPAARLSPIVVLRQVDAFARKWCKVFDVQRATTGGHLSAIRGRLAGCSDSTLREIDIELTALYGAARVATGYDDPPTAVHGERCPFCGRESLMWNRREDEFRAWCTDPDCKRLGQESGMPRSWSNETLPILRAMLEQNRTYETLAADTP